MWSWLNVTLTVCSVMSTSRPSHPVSDTLQALERLLAPRYRLGDVVGRGGMATVYRARDLRLNRDVAIKVLASDVASTVNLVRFQREIAIEAALQHAHIIPVFDAGGEGALVYYVMPLIVGETLRDRLNREPQMPLDDVIAVARDVGSALAYAHARGIVHRDIKPENILFGEGNALVSDFGIARALTQAGATTLTEGGGIVGTPAYMSPEQACGGEVVDSRTDIYALGCVVYEMIAGEPPFTGRTVQAILARQLTERPPSLRTVRPTVPAAVQIVVEQALAKQPVDRFGSATGFVQALVRAQSTSDHALPKLPAMTAAVLLRRRSWRVIASLVALAAVTAGSMWIRQRGPKPDPNRVVVFPLAVPGTATALGMGEQVALLIGSALEHTEPLRWLDGSILRLTASQDAARLSSFDAARITRAAGARYFLAGAVITERDSTIVIIHLHDAVTDSIVSQESAGGSTLTSTPPQLALRVMTRILPRLLPPNGQVNLSYLAARPPAAIADWLQGEREYSHGAYVAALGHLRRALERDSAMGVAALKGAQAAAHVEDYVTARQLVDVALRLDRQLPQHHRALARGLQQYMAGAADAALVSLNAARLADSTWNEPWMWIGETYYHLLPAATRLDLRAENAFAEAVRLHPGFAPALFHLTELAVMRMDLPRAQAMLGRFQRASPDSDWVFQANLTVKCAAGGPRGIDWRAAAERASGRVVTVALVLGSGARFPECARRAYEAVLARDASRDDQDFINRWSALKGLNYLMVSEGQAGDAAALLDSASANGMRAAVSLHVLNAAVGLGVSDSSAGAAMLSLNTTPVDRMSTTRLRYVMLWSWHRRDTVRLDSVERRSRFLADSSGLAVDRVVHNAAFARLAIMRGDSATGRRVLQLLRPAAELGPVTWDLFAGLSAERLLLSELQLASGDARAALETAEVFDSHHAQIDLLHLSRSLEIRKLAADQLGDRTLEAGFERRLRQVGRRGTP